MLETGIITLMTLEKNVDNFINVIKGKGQNPCGLRNLTGVGGGGRAGRNLSFFIYSVKAIVSFWGSPEGKIGKSLDYKISNTFFISVM